MSPYFHENLGRSHLRHCCCSSTAAFLPGKIQLLFPYRTYRCFIISLEWAGAASLKALGGDDGEGWREEESPAFLMLECK